MNRFLNLVCLAISGVMKPKDLLEQHMLRESKDKDRDDFPKVRQELFNKIISDPVFEDESNKSFLRIIGIISA